MLSSHRPSVNLRLDEDFQEGIIVQNDPVTDLGV